MTIGDVSRRSGLTASTLRFYEQEGLIAPPRRISGRRAYDEDIFLRLDIIRMTIESGFSIEEARTLINGFASATRPPERWRKLAAARLMDVRQRMAQLQRAEELLQRTIACECNSLKDCAKILLQRPSARPLRPSRRGLRSGQRPSS